MKISRNNNKLKQSKRVKGLNGEALKDDRKALKFGKKAFKRYTKGNRQALKGGKEVYIKGDVEALKKRC